MILFDVSILFPPPPLPPPLFPWQILDGEAEILMDELLQEVTPICGLDAFSGAMLEEMACMGCVEDLLNAFVDKKSIQVLLLLCCCYSSSSFSSSSSSSFFFYCFVFLLLLLLLLFLFLRLFISSFILLMFFLAFFLPVLGHFLPHIFPI